MLKAALNFRRAFTASITNALSGIPDAQDLDLDRGQAVNERERCPRDRQFTHALWHLAWVSG
jgi:hypothetical protein